MPPVYRSPALALAAVLLTYGRVDLDAPADADRFDGLDEDDRHEAARLLRQLADTFAGGLAPTKVRAKKPRAKKPAP